jgi:cohesin complex subunit SCC1
LDLGFGPDAIGSQQFDVDLDLGLDLGLDVGGGGSKRKRADGGDGEDEDDYDFDRSVEVGRDAPGSADKRSARLSLGSMMGGAADGDVTMKSTGADVFGMDWDMGPAGGEAPMDLDLDLGLGGPDPMGGDQSKYPPPPDPGSPDFTDPLNLAAPRVGTPAPVEGAGSAEKKGRGVKKPRLRKQIIDSVTELEMGRGLTSLSQSSSSQALASRQARFERGLLIESRYLPRSRVHLGLIELDAHAAEYLLPHLEKGGKLLHAGPPGLAPELAALFTFQADANKAARGKKRPADDDIDRSIELGRRQSVGAASDILGGGGVGFDDFNGFDDFGGGQDWPAGGGDTTLGDDGLGPVELDGGDRETTPTAATAGNRKPSPRKRPAAKGTDDDQGEEDEVPAFDELADDTPRGHSDSALAVFDVSTAVAVAAAASQQSQSQLEEQGESPQRRPGGYSANTLKALKVLGDRLPGAEGGEEEDSTISFEELSKNVRRPVPLPFALFIGLIKLTDNDAVWTYTGLAPCCVDHVLRDAAPRKSGLPSTGPDHAVWRRQDCSSTQVAQRHGYRPFRHSGTLSFPCYRRRKIKGATGEWIVRRFNRGWMGGAI